VNIPEPGSMLPIGRPVDGVEVCITDDTGAPVQPGEIGEIIVRNRFLAPGYWNNPELTAKAFQTDPHNSANRIYRTGDLGRWRSDGLLEHMGRKGRRIKLRGYNIEPYQVECEMMREPHVKGAVVLLYSGAAGQESSLVGYVVAPSETSTSDIRKALAKRLPSYMVPSQIVVLESFPLASSGKVDLKALPPPNRDGAAAFRGPSNDLEHELLTIWQEVLQLPAIGIDDDFFEIGGDSLQALIVFAEIEARLSCSLSPTAAVQAPTIARLANFIRKTADTQGSQSLVPLRTSGTGRPLFLLHNRYCFVMYYRHLLTALTSDRPVFGLQPPPLDGKHRIPRTVEAMAIAYVAEIRRVQPHGPYFLAGHSFGGLLSFEIAQQLVRDGERVSFLGLIDTGLLNVPSKHSPGLSQGSRIFRQLSAFVARLRWIREVAWKRWYILTLCLGRPIRHEHRPIWYDWLCARASRNYVPKPYVGHITMFSSAGNSERQSAHWGPLAEGGLTMFELPATHDDIVLPPYSKLLAKHFDYCLGKASRQRFVQGVCSLSDVNYAGPEINVTPR